MIYSTSLLNCICGNKSQVNLSSSTLIICIWIHWCAVSFSNYFKWIMLAYAVNWNLNKLCNDDRWYCSLLLGMFIGWMTSRKECVKNSVRCANMMSTLSDGWVSQKGFMIVLWSEFFLWVSGRIVEYLWDIITRLLLK